MTNRAATACETPLIADLAPQQFATALWRALGFRRHEVGRLLGVSPESADQYMQLVMRRLGLHSTAELVRRAIQEGVISLHPAIDDLEDRARTWLLDTRATGPFQFAEDVRLLQHSRRLASGAASIHRGRITDLARVKED